MKRAVTEKPSTYWENLDNTTQKRKIIKSKINNHVLNENINLICILAGGIDENGEANSFVKTRLDKGIELYNQMGKNTYILVLGGGTYHKPPHTNSNGFTVHESTCCAIYLKNRDIDPCHIIREWGSYDTIANGFFAFTNYINTLNIDELYVVTSEFHMKRTKAIFDYFNNLFRKKKKINYFETFNNLEKTILEQRCEREKKSTQNFIKNIVKCKKTIHEFVIWFYTEHKAYMSIINYEKNDKINKSY